MSIARYLSKLGALLNSNGQVLAAGHADDSVTTTKILNANVTQAKFATNVAGNGPAFSATLTSAFSIGAGTFTKIPLATKEFDTNNNYDSATNYRFTPTVAGYYQFTGSSLLQNSVSTELALSLFKNGASFRYLGNTIAPNAREVAGTTLVYMNGSTDYVELYLYSSVAGPLNASGIYTYFQGALVRAA